MTSVLGIINLHDGPHLGPLTEHRPLCAVSFLGRYGLIDFSLSNFTNSHISKVFILIEENIHAVREHIQDGSIWIHNTKTGFQRGLLNEKFIMNKKFNTDVANLSNHYSIISEVESDYVVITPPFFLSSFDYKKMIDAHIASKKDMSIAYIHVAKNQMDFVNCDEIKVEDNLVKSFSSYTGNSQADISLETYVINRKTFNEFVENYKNISLLFSLRQLIRYYLENNLITINAYHFKGFVVPILSFDGYVKQSMNLLAYNKRQKLFLPGWPIYTTTHNTPPAFYSDEAKVTNSFIANGSIIKGTVKNSIISRDVTIESGSIISDCIVFSRSIIKDGTHLSNVLVDKNVLISTKKTVNGEKNQYLYIPVGAKI